MTAVDHAAALDAIARLDDGIEQPGDRALADTYDLELQAAGDRWLHEQIARSEADYAEIRKAVFGDEGGAA